MPAGPRALLLLIALTVVTGCNGLRSLPPDGLAAAGEVVVLVDHFHSVVVVPRAAVDPPVPGLAERPDRWLSLHYGDERWLLDPTAGVSHAGTLIVAGGQGMVVMNPMPRIDPAVMVMDPGQTRRWRFPVSAEGLAAIQSRLQAHWLGPRTLALPDADAWLSYSPRRWTMSTNCHDFTIDLLRAGGLDLAGAPVLQAAGLAHRLDAARRDLDAAGIAVVGPR
jgi:hypothetical protein